MFMMDIRVIVLDPDVARVWTKDLYPTMMNAYPSNTTFGILEICIASEVEHLWTLMVLDLPVRVQEIDRRDKHAEEQARKRFGSP